MIKFGNSKSMNNKEIKIFLLDDHDFFLNIVETHLKKVEKDLKASGKDFELSITKFNDGYVLVENAKFKPDVMIIDFWLNEINPEAINGDQVFELIHKTYPLQKVVMLSGQEEAKIVHNMVKKGLRDYIMKDEEMHNHLHEVVEEVYKSKFKD